MLTGRLVRLRAMEMTDLDRCAAWINDVEVTQHLSSEAMYPFSRLAEEEWLAAAVRRTGYDNLSLAIETLEGRHIGSIGLHEARPNSRKASLGIMIGDKEHWSRGYGTDAILTLLRFVFEEMNLNRVWLEVHEDNARAIACYRRCGFVEEGRLRQDRYRGGRYLDTLVMGILVDEFQALDKKEEAS